MKTVGQQTYASSTWPGHQAREREIEKGRSYVGAACTLNGESATIVGRRNRFATVASFESALAVEYAWATVAYVMRERSGAFRA